MEKLDVIEGMSVAQKQRYGKRFVECIVKFVEETGISVNVNSNDILPSHITTVMERDLTEAIRRVYRQHIVSKNDAKSIAAMRGISESTVYSYLTTAIEKGLPVYLNKLNISRKLVEIAHKAAKEALGSNAIGDQIDYNQLKMIRGILIYEYGVESGEEKDDEIPSTSTSCTPLVSMQPKTPKAPSTSYKQPALKKFKL
uniref:HTH_40 domain-containing protein n=1 Tax=Caenorhabditis japonica TaxID=281687 RepID=A0A8R1I5I7_CAEJA